MKNRVIHNFDMLMAYKRFKIFIYISRYKSVANYHANSHGWITHPAVGRRVHEAYLRASETVNSRKITSRGQSATHAKGQCRELLLLSGSRRVRICGARTCGPVNCRRKARKMPHQPDPELYGSVFFKRLSLSLFLSLSRRTE